MIGCGEEIQRLQQKFIQRFTRSSFYFDSALPLISKWICIWTKYLVWSWIFVRVSYRHVVDPHAADGSPVVAEVVLDGRVGHLKRDRVRAMKRRDPEEEEEDEEQPTFSSSNRSVKCRMWANWRASACFCSRCWVGVESALVRTSSRQRRLDSDGNTRKLTTAPCKSFKPHFLTFWNN